MIRREFLLGLLATASSPGGLPRLLRVLGDRAGHHAVAPARDARLRSRPSPPTAPVSSGRHALPASAGPGAYLRVPPVVDDGRGGPGGVAVPLVVYFHGATRAFPPMDRLAAEADRRGFALAVPMAREHTWDLMRERAYAHDVRAVDAALAATFQRVRVDPARICLAGFSDGASYALSLGLQNGDLVSHVMAFSPGFIGPGEPVGEPRVFISHGTADRILPLERTTRRILAQLQRRGLEVEYREFEGGHGVPAPVEVAALEWMLGR